MCRSVPRRPSSSATRVHMQETPAQYIMWRFAGNDDKRAPCSSVLSSPSMSLPAPRRSLEHWLRIHRGPDRAAKMELAVTSYCGGWKMKMQLCATQLFNCGVLVRIEPTGRFGQVSFGFCHAARKFEESSMMEHSRELSQQRRCGVTLSHCCCGSRDVAASHSQRCCGSRDVAASHSHTAVAAAETFRRHSGKLLLRQQGRCQWWLHRISSCGDRSAALAMKLH